MNIKAQEYIIKELHKLYEEFTAIQIRYEFNEGLSTHFIEVLPLKIYDGQEYLLAEMRIMDTFEEKFGDKEEILFISKDSLNCIESPSYKLGYGTESFGFNLKNNSDKISFQGQYNSSLENLNNLGLIYAIAA